MYKNFSCYIAMITERKMILADILGNADNSQLYFISGLFAVLGNRITISLFLIFVY